jgi:hypothetical protein
MYSIVSLTSSLYQHVGAMLETACCRLYNGVNCTTSEGASISVNSNETVTIVLLNPMTHSAGKNRLNLSNRVLSGFRRNFLSYFLLTFLSFLLSEDDRCCRLL